MTWGVANGVSEATSCDGVAIFTVLKDSGDVAPCGCEFVLSV